MGLFLQPFTFAGRTNAVYCLQNYTSTHRKGGHFYDSGFTLPHQIIGRLNGY